MPQRTIRYRDIASELRGRIEAGDFSAGRVLPSESELSKEFGASRVTIRRSLELLREEGLVSSRQGFGWFVAVDRLQQSLGRLGTIEAQLARSNRNSEREVLGFAFLPASAHVAAVLGKGTVLEVTRRNLANGEPFARVTVWCPERLGADLSRQDVEQHTFYELLDDHIGGAQQTIAAGAASADDSEVLQIPEGSPVLLCRRTTSDNAGSAILFSEHVFPAHLTEFVVDLPKAASSMSPNGLRLVDGGQHHYEPRSASNS